jgi:hypothetical protein
MEFICFVSLNVTGWSVDNEMERMWQEAVVEFAWGNWEKPRKTSVSITVLRAEIWTRDLTNMESYSHDLDFINLSNVYEGLES